MNASAPVALVLVRDPGTAKSRLGPALRPRERAALAGAMLVDVVAALRGAEVGRVVVLAGGDEAAAAARSLGVDVLLDPPGGHGIDAAVTAASRRLRARSSLVVPADLALLRAEDVAALLAQPGDVVVAATSDAGTGGLLRRPAWGIPTAFGPHSAARHLLVARQAGLTAERVEIPGFALDVDEPSDLLAAASSPALGRVTARVLAELGPLDERLAMTDPAPGTSAAS